MDTKLAEFIKDNRMSYAEFAEEIGVSENYIYQLVSGRKPFTEALKFRIAARFGWKAANELMRERQPA